MDLYDDLNKIFIDCTCVFFMLFYLFFICCLIWQHYKNKREQKKILEQYRKNLEILQDLKNRF